MSRGVGEFSVVQELVPEWLVLVVALFTQLADAWFVGLLLVGCYLLLPERREGVATVLAAAFGAVGFYRGLKHVFAFPRPEQPLVEGELPWLFQLVYDLTGTASGYGFPSGHATIATVVYLGLAGVLAVGSRRQRYGAAVAVIALVSLTRVALGVHYLVDVVAGVLVGGTVLVGTLWLSRRAPLDAPTVAFALAVPLAGFYLVLSPPSWEAVVLLAVTLGSLAGWQFVALDGLHATDVRLSRADWRGAARGWVAVLVPGALAATALVAALSGAVVLAVASGAGLAAVAVLALPATRWSRYPDRVRRRFLDRGPASGRHTDD